MKTGKTLSELAAQIKREQAEKVDYRVPTTKLGFVASGDRGQIEFTADGQERACIPTEHCVHQICARVGIPRPYADKMTGEHLDLLAQNINYWFQHKPEKRMLRTLLNGQHVARAFLSERYRALDNADLAEAVLPRLADAGCEILSGEITERRFYIKAATPRLELDLNKLRREVGGDTHSPAAYAKIKELDPVQAGVVISNSEVGSGSLRVEPMLYRLVCLNGLITAQAIRRYHVGRGRSEYAELEEAAQYFSDATREMDDRAFWAKVCDVVSGVFDTERFQGLAEKFAATGALTLPSPSDAVEIIAKRYTLNERESKGVLDHLIEGGDNTPFGLANAVTRTASDVDSYDRATELERLGGEIIELPQTVWAKN
jgi:Domain of unknown function (DUF932)